MLLELYEGVRWDLGSVHYCRRALRFERRGEKSRDTKKKSNPKQVKVLISNVLLTIKMNVLMLPAQQIHSHMANYVTLPESCKAKIMPLNL